MISFPLTIGGRSQDTEGGFEVINPATGRPLGQSPRATPAMVDEAVQNARGASAHWSRTPDADRVHSLNAIADLLERHAAELSKLVTLEQGKPQSGRGANFELGGCVAWTRATASLNLPEETIQDDESGRIVVRRKPVGVVGSITPWNWPLLIATWQIMPALRVGATVVIKPSPYAKVPVGDGMDRTTLLGPLTNRSQLDTVRRYVAEAVKKGARVAGSPPTIAGPGFFHPPTIVANATDDMLLVKEEQFGTAIPVLKYRTADEAIARANSLEVGLGGSVWGNDIEEASAFASQLVCGTAWVNQHGVLHPMAPFGGVSPGSVQNSVSTDLRNTRPFRW